MKNKTELNIRYDTDNDTVIMWYDVDFTCGHFFFKLKIKKKSNHLTRDIHCSHFVNDLHIITKKNQINKK